MKIKWNEKYNTIAIYSLIVLILSILFYLIASQVGIFKLQVWKYLSIFEPIFIGLTMAYIFNFILDIYERILEKKVFDKEELKKYIRPISLIMTYITVFLILLLFLSFILPQLINSISGLVNNIPKYVKDLSDLLEKIGGSIILPEAYIDVLNLKWEQFIETIVEFGTSLVPKLGSLAKNTISSIWNIVLGIIISIYILMDKEKFIAITKKLTASIFSKQANDRILELTIRADLIFGKFISGKILDSLIVGILTFLILRVAKMPYSLLVSFIIGVTNIIPFFGPFIGAIPSFFIILLEAPIKAFWFLIIILIIQQIDGNIIGPKILGDSLGISAFWILFSLLVAGKLLGFIGLVIGVPLFVFIYSVIQDIVDRKLKKKGLSTNLKEYY